MADAPREADVAQHLGPNASPTSTADSRAVANHLGRSPYAELRRSAAEAFGDFWVVNDDEGKPGGRDDLAQRRRWLIEQAWTSEYGSRTSIPAGGLDS